MTSKGEVGRFLFHVRWGRHEVGDHLPHRQYGASAREVTGKNPSVAPERLSALLWEIALETARLAVAPEAVSRLECLFAAATAEMARMFRDRFRPGAGIYLIEPWADAKLYRGNFGLITSIAAEASFLDYMPADALRYWRETPSAEDEVEVLIGGPARVQGLIEPSAR